MMSSWFLRILAISLALEEARKSRHWNEWNASKTAKRYSGFLVFSFNFICQLLLEIPPLYYRDITRVMCLKVDSFSHSSKFLSRRNLILWPEAATSQPSVAQGQVFRHLIFTSATTKFGSHLTHRISRIPELIERRRAQLNELKMSRKPSVKSPPTSPRKKALQKQNEHFIHENAVSLKRYGIWI